MKLSANNINDTDVLKFLTCGSVDDGKSTLIGRMLYDSNLLLEDQIGSLKKESKKNNKNSDILDFSLLVDGLQSEREQGITIDVAYRYFSTKKRKFIAADSPGHLQYTRNMVTAASNCNLAVILIDARKGILNQTKRHTYILSCFGIKHIVVAINKMDLVQYSQEIYKNISNEYYKFSQGLNFETISTIPMSATLGDNITNTSSNMPWYNGPCFLEYIENIEIENNLALKPFRMPVQWVNRANIDFRGYAGKICAGQINIGDHIILAKNGIKSKVKNIYLGENELQSAYCGQSIILTLEDEIDISRGDILSSTNDRPENGRQFQAQVIWMGETPLFPSRQYLLKSATKTVSCSITEIKHKIDFDNFKHLAAKKLVMNEIGLVNIETIENLTLEPFSKNKTTGSFILIDKETNLTVAAGMIDFMLRRASNINWQHLEINKTIRSNIKKQKPVILWLTGLSGAGKSTIANLIDAKLTGLGFHTYLLDGDNIRHGINKDLGFTEEDRVENIRRVAEIAKLMIDAGLITIVSLISPFESERKMARELVDNSEFVEIYVDTPLDIAEKRDVKGLYKKARSGLLKNFTGIDSPYEIPLNPELVLNTIKHKPEELADIILNYLAENKYIN